MFKEVQDDLDTLIDKLGRHSNPVWLPPVVDRIPRSNDRLDEVRQWPPDHRFMFSLTRLVPCKEIDSEEDTFLPSVVLYLIHTLRTEECRVDLHRTVTQWEIGWSQEHDDAVAHLEVASDCTVNVVRIQTAATRDEGESIGVGRYPMIVSENAPYADRDLAVQERTRVVLVRVLPLLSARLVPKGPGDVANDALKHQRSCVDDTLGRNTLECRKEGAGRVFSYLPDGFRRWRRRGAR